jgi:hypothetical protein
MMFKNSVIKSISLEKTIAKNIDLAVKSLEKEIKTKSLADVRYSGGGELSSHGILLISKLSELLPDVIFWGFTRRIEIAEKLEELRPNVKFIFSLDSSTPKSVLNAMKDKGWKTSWLYESNQDEIPENVHVIFRNHKHGKVDDSLINKKAECPAIINSSLKCKDCGHCFK